MVLCLYYNGVVNFNKVIRKILASIFQIIKLFYAKVNLAKDGKVTEYKDGNLYYVNAEPTKNSGGEMELDAINVTDINTTDYKEGNDNAFFMYGDGKTQ